MTAIAGERRGRQPAPFTEEDLAEVVAVALPDGAGGWRVRSTELLAVRMQRGKRIAECALTYSVGGGPAVTDRLVVKLYGSDRGAPALAALAALWDAGFRSPAAHRVPRPYGYAPGHGALLQQHVSGTPWADCLLGPQRDSAAETAADWLLALQGGAAGGPAVPAGHDGHEVERFAHELGAEFPVVRERLQRLAGRLGRLLDGPEPAVPSHGDYHPKNVFLDDAGAVVIDFDTFGCREPAADLGYALGQLLIMSAFRLGDLRPGQLAAGAFWRRYADAGGAASAERVAAHVGRTLMQSLHYELCTLRNGRVDLLHRWPELIEAVLASPSEWPGWRDGVGC